jgi:nucleoside-diphosphate-sugar epimerase
MTRPAGGHGTILLTGATGSIGRPLLDALLVRGAAAVYLLAHVDQLVVDDPRVHVMSGDVTAGPHLGLEPARVRQLQSTITAVVHAAAETRFDMPLETVRRTNVDGTRHVLAFASGCGKLDRVVALSTMHVAGRRTGTIAEDDLEHDAGFVNTYERSKYEAECELRAAQGGLPISVCRLSTVAGHSRTGAITRRSALHRAALLMYTSLAPMIPGREDSPVDLIALEYAVGAVAWFVTDGFMPGRTWHIGAGPDVITAGELLDLTLDAFHRYRPAWRTRAIARPALVDLATFELFLRTVDQVGDAALRASTAVVSHFAPQLAYPKRFDTTRCDAAMASAGIMRPPARDTWSHAVRRLVDPAFAEAAHAEVQCG